MSVVFDPFHPDHRRDPYPHYHALREADPVQRHPLLPAWILTRYCDVLDALRDPRLSVDRTQSNLFRGPHSPLKKLGDGFRTAFLNMMLFRDPPDHTRLRNLVNKVFTPRMVESLRPRIQKIVDDHLDAVEERGEMDLVRDLAYPFPVTVIAEMLGIPAADREEFRRWSLDLVALTEPTALFTPGAADTAERSLGEMRRYFDGIVAERRAEPRDDLLSALAQASEDGDRLSGDELFAMSVLILVAGHETTANLIGNAVLALLRNPGERKRLIDDPALIRTAVDEFLRYDSVVQATARIALEECEIGGKKISEGEPLILVIGAANRDPAQFPEPDRLDLGRQENRHLALGFGAHFCLGARLAQLETSVAVGTLLRRFPKFEGDGSEPDWKPTALLRGLASLRLTF
ncbi:MAG: cytochrome P450 [Myxococcota bacterium]